MWKIILPLWNPRPVFRGIFFFCFFFLFFGLLGAGNYLWNTHNVQSVKDFGHGNDALDKFIKQRLLIGCFGRGRRRGGNGDLWWFLRAQLGVQMMLPRHGIRRVDLLRKGQLRPGKVANLVLCHALTCRIPI